MGNRYSWRRHTGAFRLELARIDLMTDRRALASIFCTATVDVLALGIVYPVLPMLLLGFSGGDTSHAAETLVLFTCTWGLMQFLFSPVLGALSDRFGRRPVILISCLGLSLDHVFMAIAPTLGLLYVGRIVSGITSATISTARAYVADVSTPEQRARAFGIVGMSWGIGFIIGPAIGGFLGEIDPRLPFWVAAAATLANACFAWFSLPESLPPEKRTAFSWKRANPLGAFKLLASHRELTSLATIHLINNVVQQVLPAVFVLYTAHRYGWDDRTVGLTLMTLGVCTVMVQGLVVGPVVDRLGPRLTLVVGLLWGVTGLSIYALAPSGPWLWLGLPAVALWSMSSPALQALMSREVSPSEQGLLQGANNCLRSLSVTAGPAMFGSLFAWLVNPLPGAPFLAAATLLCAAIAVAWLATKHALPGVPSR
jgi:MFS transporter, DHA1 family, tetracycline resistance protein